MNGEASKQAAGFLFRFRKQDTPTGVSEETVNKLIDATGLTRAELVHFALRQMANQYLPFYEADEGPLAAEQIQAIRAASSATNTPEEEFSERLF